MLCQRSSDNKYAHANAIRRALSMVTGSVQVVVGVHSDEEITKYVLTWSTLLRSQTIDIFRHKGPPLLDESER